MRFFLTVILITKITLFAGPCSAPWLGARHSGAPGEVSCTGCHSGSANTGSGTTNYQIGNGTTSYFPNEFYKIVFSIREENVNQFGFQTVALKESNNSNAGTFTLTDSENTRLIEDDHNGSDRIYVGHTVCGADAEPPGFRQWSFNWQAPAEDVGDINFYLSALTANHNHSASGDQTYTQIITLVYNDESLGVFDSDRNIRAADDFRLIDAHPNPFNAATTINFALPFDSKVTIKVFTLHGREIATIVNGRLNAGFHFVNWNAINQSSGMYLVKMIPGSINTQKLIIIK